MGVLYVLTQGCFLWQVVVCIARPSGLADFLGSGVTVVVVYIYLTLSVMPNYPTYRL